MSTEQATTGFSRPEAGFLAGRTGLVMGIANHRSIAWGIARRAAATGARLALSYQGERLQKSVEELAGQLEDPVLVSCDVTRDEDLESLAGTLRDAFGSLDFIVHSIAYANKDELRAPFYETSRDGFRIAHDISSYSLTAVTRAMLPLMRDRPGSILAMTFQGSSRVFPGYNVMGVAKASLEASIRYLASELGPMGIRVNALSAGPIKTLAAAGISGFNTILAEHRERAPLRRNVEVDEVADAGLFLLGPAARGITGQILYVDGGYHIMGG